MINLFMYKVQGNFDRVLDRRIFAIGASYLNKHLRVQLLEEDRGAEALRRCSAVLRVCTMMRQAGRTRLVYSSNDSVTRTDVFS